MIHKLPSIIFAEIVDAVGPFKILVSRDQQIEILKLKLNEAIRHINVLEEKLLSPDEHPE